MCMRSRASPNPKRYTNDTILSQKVKAEQHLFLREWRLRHAMSQEDLSRASSVGRATIARIESARHPALPSTVRRLAQAFGLKPEELYAHPEHTVGKRGVRR